MGQSIENIMLISTSMTLAVPDDDNDNRIFAACDDCKGAILIYDTSMPSNQPVTERLMNAITHVFNCPYDGPRIKK